MPKRFDVVTIGSAVQDVFLVSDAIQIIKSSRFSTGAGECVSLGSKIEIDTLHISSGGGATNAAVTFSNLGFTSTCIAKIGSDTIGSSITKDLADRGVDTSRFITAEEGKSGYSTLLTAPSGERTVLVYRGVSQDLTFEDIDWALIERASWVYLTSLGGNIKLAQRIVENCKKRRIHLAWNPGMSEIKADPKAILEILKTSVDVFNVNREEASVLTGVSEKSLLKLFINLHSDTHLIRIITDGERGSYLCNGSSCYQAGTSGAKSISRTGAGDAFGSGVVASLMQGDPIHTALRIGTLNAESVIQSLGAKEGLLTHFPSAKQLARVTVQTI